MLTDAKTIGADVIPVIDISPLRSNDDAKTVARALHGASQGLGFIYISGHGIPADVIEAARASALAFFRASDRDKSTVAISPQHRGWLAPGGARMDDDARADLKESFIWGYQDRDGRTPEDHELRGPNRWPAFVPELETDALAYFRLAHEVAHHLMRGFALGLDLDEDFFLRRSSRPLSRGSLVYYPPQASGARDEQYGVGPHTDFGVLTVLCQDDVGGLHVQGIDGEWIHAPPVDGTLIVNVGDLLSRWTDGAYKSTPHRVINRTRKERLSLVLAFDPDPETMIDARAIHGAGYRPKDAAISCGDYLVWRFAKAFDYRRV